MQRIIEANKINIDEYVITSQTDSIIGSQIPYNYSIVSMKCQTSIEKARRVSINTPRSNSFIHQSSTACDEESDFGSFTFSDRTKKLKKQIVVNDYSESERDEYSSEDDKNLDKVSKIFFNEIQSIQIPDKIVRESLMAPQEDISDISSV